MTGLIILLLIYGVSIILWCRYLYIKSLKKTPDRQHALQRLTDLTLYIPLGLHAIFLFCYGIYEILPLSIKFIDLSNILILKNKEIGYPDLYAFKNILIQTFIMAFIYTLIKAYWSLSNKAGRWIYQFSLFLVSLFFLKLSVLNMLQSLYFATTENPSVNYNNSYLWLFFIPLPLLAFLNGGWIYKTRWLFLKYGSLAAKILLIYLSIIFLLTLFGVILLFIPTK